MAGHGGSIGHGGGTGGADPKVFGTEGQACASLGALACAGPSQQQTLICNAGTWRALSTCPTNQRCDRTSGVCTDVAAGCDGQEPGFSVCETASVARACGPDLVTLVDTMCPGVCASGACQGAACGDGTVEGAEECDDGNTIAADGCEPDCTRTQVLALAAGRAHTCALLSHGNVRCWGENSQGQLGMGTSQDRSGLQPYQNDLVGLGGPAMTVAAGGDHTCALMADASMRCWGANDHGQLGLGTTAALGDDELPATAAPIALDRPVTAIAAGGNVTCAILDDGSLRCWGQNNYGQLGLGHTRDIGDDELPTRAIATVSVGGPALLAATGGNHTCVMLAEGVGTCFGLNGLGQLGLGITQNVGDTDVPSDVPPFMFPSATGLFTQLVVGASRACALDSTGTVWCWGDNSDGGLGLNFVGADPTRKANEWGFWSWTGTPPLRIDAGGYHLCVNLSSGVLRCWGINDKGQLGLPTTNTLGDDDQLVDVAPIDLGLDGNGFPSYPWTETAGAAHTCALLDGGDVRCWGANESGQLGFGYASAPPTDYVGGTPDTVPGKEPAINIVSSR